MERKRIAIIGAGGCAREVAWLIKEINRVHPIYEFVGFLVSDLSRLGDRDSRNQVVGDFSWLEKNASSVAALALGIGTPSVRLRIGQELATRYPNLEWPTLVHPTGRYDEDTCQLGRGVLWFANVLGTVNLQIGDFSMISNGCTIGHESKIGKGCLLNPSVNISGGVLIENEVLVGVGAQVLQYLRIEAGATIGAGAVVTKSVPEGITVVGVPAYPLSKPQLPPSHLRTDQSTTLSP